MDIPLLGQKRPDPVPALGPAQPMTATTAFLVIIQPDGNVVWNKDINAPVLITREPHRDEVKGAATVLAAKLLVEETASVTSQAMVARAQQAQAAMMNAQQTAEVQAALAATQNGPRGRV